MFESEAVRCKSKRKIGRKGRKEEGGKEERKDIYLSNLFTYSSVDISNRFFSKHSLGTFSILDNNSFL